MPVCDFVYYHIAKQLLELDWAIILRNGVDSFIENYLTPNED